MLNTLFRMKQENDPKATNYEEKLHIKAESKQC
jgi:hypothetical protein